MPVAPAHSMALAAARTRTREPLAAPAHKRAALGAPHEEPIGKLGHMATVWVRECLRCSALIEAGMQQCNSSRILTKCEQVMCAAISFGLTVQGAIRSGSWPDLGLSPHGVLCIGGVPAHCCRLPEAPGLGAVVGKDHPDRKMHFTRVAVLHLHIFRALSAYKVV